MVNVIEHEQEVKGTQSTDITFNDINDLRVILKDRTIKSQFFRRIFICLRPYCSTNSD